MLDTGAVFELLNKHRPPLLRILQAADLRAEPVWVPTPVLVEVGQAKAPPSKRLKAIWEIANVAELDERIAYAAADALRSVSREKCSECSNFVRPTLVDAVVMALAADYAEVIPQVIVYTQDLDDMNALRAHFPKVIVKRA